MAGIMFDGTSLGNYGLVTPRIAGVHDLAAAAINRQFIAGCLAPTDTLQRVADLVKMTFGCVVYSETSHTDLVEKLQNLKALANPSKGWRFLEIEDRLNQRTLALPGAFPVDIDAVPYAQTAVEFNWQWERLGYWEDAAATTKTNPTQIDNLGDIATYPIYTCTVAETLGTGLTFTVGALTFEYTGALVATDVLVVDAEAMTCTKNGAVAMANVDADSEFPELVVGTSTVSKSSADFSLAITYRQRYL